jgi:pyrroloquinoline quinone (PQQ) biosynthesis protein C
MPFHDDLVRDTVVERQALVRVPQLQDGLAGAISREAYIDYLTQAYHHVRHTVPLLRLARRRAAGRLLIEAALDEYIAEETGHEHWVLADINAAGGDAAVAAASTPHAATAAMVNRAYECVGQDNPLCMFGMVYVLEGTSVAMASQGAAAIQSRLGLPDAAFTYLTSHGALDQQHLRYFERLMNTIDDPDDQRAIVRMAREMFRLFADLFRSIDTGVRHAAA